MLRLTYANQQVVKKSYDKYGRLIQLNEGISGPVLAKFIYSDEEVANTVTEPTDSSLVISGSSKLRVVIDTTANTRTEYIYDEAGVLKEVKNQNITITRPEDQDDDDWDKKVEYSLGEDKITTGYKYVSDTDNSLLSEETNLNSLCKVSTSYAKDSLKRPTSTTVMCGTNGHKYTYSYIPRQTKTWVSTGGGQIILSDSVGAGTASPYALTGRWQIDDVGATPYVSKFEEYSMSGDTATLVRTDAITYDANGNITKYGNVTYEYDNLGRLTKEINPTIDRVKEWCYDVGGNITSRTEHKYTTGEDLGTFVYEYDSVWKDRLKSIGSQTISYKDDVANPTSYKGATLVWKRGRLLASYNSIEMEYDANGTRCSKKVPESGQDITWHYIYNGSNLIREDKVDDPYSQKTFLYNSQGIIGFIYQGVTYTYRKNLFGDIVAIYSGATKVAEYAYDAWGNCTIVSEIGNIGTSNPFRYRGYYWDNDLQLYYLMSRYYDPQTGRFINADSLEYLDPESINGLNLYAYCYNNPIMYADPSGHVPEWLRGLAIGLAIVGAVFVAGAITVLTAGAGWAFMATTMAGAILHGAAVGTLIGAGVGVVAGAIIGGATSDWSVEGILTGMGIGFGGGAIIGAIVGGSVGAYQYSSAVSSWHGGKEKMISHFMDHGKKEGYKNVIQYTRSAKKVIKNGTYIAQKNAYLISKTANKFYYVGVAQNSTLITTYYTKTLTKTAMALLGLI